MYKVREPYLRGEPYGTERDHFEINVVVSTHDSDETQSHVLPIIVFRVEFFEVVAVDTPEAGRSAWNRVVALILWSVWSRLAHCIVPVFRRVRRRIRRAHPGR